jgi:hypothetical protein
VREDTGGETVRVLDIDNVKIPSINKKYILSNGRLVLSREYRDFKNLLTGLVSRRMKFAPPHFMSIEISTYKDIDNCVKLIIDAVAGAGIIENDRSVLQLYVEKIPRKKGEPERLIVSVE